MKETEKSFTVAEKLSKIDKGMKILHPEIMWIHGLSQAQ